jgi:CxxC-x17-CxxC domain-containing protein
MGLDGTAITLVGHRELLELNRIKALTKTTIEELEGHHNAYRQSPTRPRHNAVCTECGKPCEVPFEPDPYRPVYCKTCWATQRPPILSPVQMLNQR